MMVCVVVVLIVSRVIVGDGVDVFPACVVDVFLIVANVLVFLCVVFGWLFVVCGLLFYFW